MDPFLLPLNTRGEGRKTIWSELESNPGPLAPLATALTATPFLLWRGQCFLKDGLSRFCCKKEREAQWGSWSSWTECTRKCGGGHRKRDRVCVKKEGNKESCFMVGPNGDKRYRLQEELCNPLPCPSEKSPPIFLIVI